MNPLLIKGLCGLLGVGTVAVACVYGPGLLERKDKTVESADDSDKNKGAKRVDEERVEDTTEQNQCAYFLDSMAKEIKLIFNSTYLEGGWTPKANGGELSEADKKILEEKKVRFESWSSDGAKNCRNYLRIEEKIGKVLGFLKDPKVSRVKEEYWRPMKEMLREVGSSSWEGY